MEAVQIENMEVVVEKQHEEQQQEQRRLKSCLKVKVLEPEEPEEPELKKAKVLPRHPSFANTDSCDICLSSPSDLNCGVCKRVRQTIAVGGATRKRMRKNDAICECKCTCHKHHPRTEEDPVVPTGKEERDLLQHNAENKINRKIHDHQREMLSLLLTRRDEVNRGRASLQKLKGFLEWGRGRWVTAFRPAWVGVDEEFDFVLEKFFEQKEVKFFEQLYVDEEWNEAAEKLLGEKIEHFEASMQKDADHLYKMLAKDRLKPILRFMVHFHGGVIKCDALFPGQEITKVNLTTQMTTLFDAVDKDKLSGEELDDLVRQDFGDRGEIDIVRLIHLFDKLQGVPVVDGEFRPRPGAAVTPEDAELFLYDINYLGRSLFTIAKEETQENFSKSNAVLEQSLKQGLLLPQTGGVKGFRLPVNPVPVPMDN